MRLFFKIATFVALIISFPSYSQIDSTDIYLNRVVLDKNLTQKIVIKGKDLEKVPFLNLEEAIRSWAYGYFSRGRNMSFIVDGVVASDVNIYSIYDIEEIEIIQNALININGAMNEQQMVFITTRKNKSGFEIAGTSSVITYNKAINSFNRYYISYSKQFKQTNFSLGGEYIQDVIPEKKDSLLKQPQKIDRLKFRVTVNHNFSSNHSISAFANYTPQLLKYEWMAYENHYLKQFQRKIIEEAFAIGLNFRSVFFKRLINDFSAASSRKIYDGKFIRKTISPSYLDITEEMKTYVNDEFYDVHNFSLVLKDNLRYTLAAKNWNISPTLNLFFKKDYSNLNYTARDYYPASANSTPHAYGNIKSQNELLLLTPSLSLTYNNSFNFLIGAVKNISSLDKWERKHTTKTLPFFSTTLDVIRVHNPKSSSGLKLYFSYIKSSKYDSALHLANFQYFENLNPFGSASPGHGTNTITGNSFQAGSELSLKENVLTFSYNLDHRDYKLQSLHKSWYEDGIFYVEVKPSKTWTHRLGVDLRIEKKDFKWLISGYTIKKNTILEKDAWFSWFSKKASRTDNTIQMWAGGFINRINYKKLTFGADAMYAFGERRVIVEQFTNHSSIEDSFVLQNLYLGYSFGKLDIYLNSRNPIESKNSLLTDNRKFYGIGVKLVL